MASVSTESPGPDTRLRVDPTACEGIGICAHLTPTLIGVDTWGYPVVTPRGLTGGDVRRARAAVAACPRRALFLAPRGPEGSR